MFASVLKSSDAAKKAWSTRRRIAGTSKEAFLRGPDGKGTKTLKPPTSKSKSKKFDSSHASSIAATLGVV